MASWPRWGTCIAKYSLAVLPGDGIGLEVIAEACKVLGALSLDVELRDDLVGGAAIDAYGTALRPETVELAQTSDAVLFGAVGGPKWDDPKAPVRPEQAILGLRAALGTFANLRPARMQPALVHLSPLKAEIVQGADVLFVRELVAGTYFAEPKKYWHEDGQWRAIDTTAYTEHEVERTVRMAFDLARTRRKRLHVADKQNVMATSRLWRDVATRVSADYPDVEFLAILTDALAMHLLYRPTAFDVVVTDNLFGDLLTDEAAAGGLDGADAQRQPGRSAQPARRLPRHCSGQSMAPRPDIARSGQSQPDRRDRASPLLLRYSCAWSAKLARSERR
jgi:3-isopropylmalate dehydrogenase